ncbi:MAG: hypothetical protein ACLQVG_27000 [Terriglobia bacterium]
MLNRRSFLAISLAAPYGLLSARGNNKQEHPQFVRVSPRDYRYFELADGSPYIPIGLNMISPPEGARDDEVAGLNGFEGWIEKLARNGGNYIRVWLSSPFWSVEHEKCGVYDPMKARRIDRLLELCGRYHIHVKLTMEHFRSIGGGPQPWADNPLYSITHNGPATSIADFFDGEESRAQFRKKVQWYSQRYADDPIIYGWELWNEINAVHGGDFLAWTEAMLPELHKAFPKNLAMQSLGSFDRDRAREFYRPLSLMAGNDVAQVHRYLDQGAELEVCHGPVDILAVDAIRELRSYHPGRPIILAESGAVEPSHSGPSHLYAKDRAGIILHDILFAPFFSGAAGSGQIWHWEEYVDANNLWYHFGRFAEAVRGLDPPAEAFEPVVIEHPRLRVYVLKGKRTWLAWCRDSRNDWRTEIERGEQPEVLADITVDFGREGSGRVYDPWSGKWSGANLSGGKILLPEFSRSLVVRLDTVQEKT